MLPFLLPSLVHWAQAFNLGTLQPLQHGADQINADTRTGVLNVGHAEGGALPGDGRLDERGFLAARTLDLAESAFEFLTCLRQGVEEEIDCRPGIVFAFVPTLRALLGGLRSSAPCFVRSGVRN